MDVSTILKSPNVVRRGIFVEAVYAAENLNKNLAENSVSEDDRFLCSEMLTGSLFYLWQLLLHLISSAGFGGFTKNNYSCSEIDLLHPPNRAPSLIFLWQHPVVIRAVLSFEGLCSLGH